MFHGYIGRECRFIQQSWKDMEAILAIRTSQKLSEDEVNRFWYAVDAFLMASANISKTLWGSERSDRAYNERTVERGKELRTRIEVGSLPNLKAKKVRDYFEHFDSKIDAWCLLDHDCVYDSNIKPNREFRKIKGTDRLRVFDPESKCLHVGERLQLNFGAVLKEVFEIQSKLDAHLPRVDSE